MIASKELSSKSFIHKLIIGSVHVSRDIYFLLSNHDLEKKFKFSLEYKTNENRNTNFMPQETMASGQKKAKFNKSSQLINMRQEG